LVVKLFTAAKPGGAGYRQVVLPKPPNLPDMPDARHAPPRPADAGVPVKVDLRTITTPTK
jgi:hypothetical protein